MSPSVNFGDSGEFVAAAATLSIPHAPGYPLYCLAGHALGTLLPWGNWAYRVNLLSVLCAGGALSLLWSALRRAGFSRLAATVGTLTLGASPLWLHTSLQAEVFGLNSLLAACLLWIACRHQGSLFGSRPMAAMGLCLGLGGGNHHMLIFVVPAVLAEAWTREPDRRRAAEGLLWMGLFSLLGLAVYLYLPIRARAFPPLDWGHPASWKAFLHVLLRKDYGSFALTVEGAAGSRWVALGRQGARYLRESLAGLGFVAAALALAGAASWRLRGGGVLTWRLPALWVLLSGPGFLWLGNPPFDALTSGALSRFYLLSWLGAALAIAAGVGFVESLLPRAASLLLAFPVLFAALSSDVWCQRADLASYDYGRNLLRSLPRDALLFIDGGDDTFYSLAYLQYAEGLRRDVEPHDRGGLVFPNAYGVDFRSLTREEKERRRLAVEADEASRRQVFYSTLRDEILPGRELGPWGLLRRLGPEARGLWEIYPGRFSRALARAHYRYRGLVPLYAVMRAAGEPDASRALLYLRQAAADGPDVQWLPGVVSARAQWVGYRAAQRLDWPSAERAYRLAAVVDAKQGGPWTNLGVALERQRRREEAEAAYLRATELGGDAFTAYHNLGSFYWSLKRWDRAADMFERASSLRPADAETRRFLEMARARAKGAR